MQDRGNRHGRGGWKKGVLVLGPLELLCFLRIRYPLFTLLYQYINSLYCSLYISYGTNWENYSLIKSFLSY